MESLFLFLSLSLSLSLSRVLCFCGLGLLLVDENCWSLDDTVNAHLFSVWLTGKYREKIETQVSVC